MCEVRDLKPNGANILVTEENKKEYVHLVCQMKMTGDHVTLPSSSSSWLMGHCVVEVQMGLVTLCVCVCAPLAVSAHQVPFGNSWRPSWKDSMRSSPRG